MPQPDARIIDLKVEQFLGFLLRAGVMLAALVVLAGGVFYLTEFGGKATDRRVFASEPPELRTLPGIVQDALALESRGIIQLGLLLLIATPVARVAFSILAFALERDWIYVLIATVVLGALVISLAGGRF